MFEASGKAERTLPPKYAKFFIGASRVETPRLENRCDKLVPAKALFGARGRGTKHRFEHL